MASKFLKTTSYHAKNHLEVSLIQAFEDLQPKLIPPFSLKIPSPQEYSQLNRAILYGVLTQTHLAKTHLKHLHAVVTDGYALFVSLILEIVNDLYVKLVDSVKRQLVLVVKEMVEVLGVGFGGLLVGLLRQIVGGDFSEGNLWLCYELVNVFLVNWDCFVEEEPMVLNSALYVFLRLLADHCRLSGGSVRVEALRKLEIEFCVKMLRERFHSCMKIGRDLVRLLQDLVHVPEFRAVWKDLLLNPGEFKTAEFSDISQLYCCRTSSRYFLLRTTLEMETQLRFLLTHVKFGNQRRYQLWFAKKFLYQPERETVVIDIVRFICCAHHPSNEIIQSDIIPRWAIIGWLLKSCRKNYVEANAKLALFFDWLFFDERVDNIMNIEPAMLLMIFSIPKYIEMTQSLLEFLLLLADNYDLDHNYVILRGLSTAFSVLVRKGVIRSLDVLTSCDVLAPSLKEKLWRLLSRLNVGLNGEMKLPNLPHSVPPSSLQNMSYLGTPMPSSEQESAGILENKLSTKPLDTSIHISKDSVTTASPLGITNESQFHDVESLVQNLADALKKSNTLGLQILETMLISFANLDDQMPTSDLISPEIFSSNIADQFESIGCRLFAPLDNNLDFACSDNINVSATALIIRAFICSPHERMQGMLAFWSRNSFPVGASLLCYASRLAYEASVTGYTENGLVDGNSAKGSDSMIPLLAFYIDGYFSILNGKKEDSHKGVNFSSKVDKEFVSKLVENAFDAYKQYLMYCKTILHKDHDASPTKLLVSDMILCSQWEREKSKFLFSSLFHHLSDLCTGVVDIIRLIVSQLDHADLLDMQFQVGLKRYSVFGDNNKTILHIVKNSLSWDSSEQHKLWGLMRSEIAVSKLQVEKIILEFFCSDELDVNISAIAVGGLLTLCSCRAPTPDLVGAIMLLPNNVFPDFAATALSSWAVSNTSMLFDSLAKFSEKINNKNVDAIGSDGVTVNHSAILWLLDYFGTQGINDHNILSIFPSL